MSSAMMKDCLAACLACSRACNELIPHCLEKGSEHAAPEHISLLLDCADICAVSARFLERGSDLHRVVCAAAGEIAHACEESCEEFPDDPLMVACADACRRCKESCRRMGAIELGETVPSDRML